MLENDALIEQIRLRVPSTFPTASLQTLQSAEANLGFVLPDLLRALYLKVGNGFSTSAGGDLIGLQGGHTPDGDTLDSLHWIMHDPNEPSECPFEFNGELLPALPPKLLHVFAWPCIRYTCLDCSRAEAPVYVIDCNFYDGYKPTRPLPIMLHKATFAEFLQDWAEGKDLMDQIEILVAAYEFPADQA